MALVACWNKDHCNGVIDANVESEIIIYPDKGCLVFSIECQQWNEIDLSLAIELLKGRNVAIPEGLECEG